jgi:hypothetical protein
MMPADGIDRTFDQADDVADRYFLGRLRQRKSTADSALACHIPGTLDDQHDLFQLMHGDILTTGDFRKGDQPSGFIVHRRVKNRLQR